MSIANETGTGDTGPMSGDQGVQQCAADLKSVAADKVAQVRDQASAMYDKGREKAQAYYEQGMSTAQEYYQDGRDRAMEFEENVEQYIRNKPIQSVLIAVGVGALLGALLKR